MFPAPNEYFRIITGEIPSKPPEKNPIYSKPLMKIEGNNEVEYSEMEALYKWCDLLTTLNAKRLYNLDSSKLCFNDNGVVLWSTSSRVFWSTL